MFSLVFVQNNTTYMVEQGDDLLDDEKADLIFYFGSVEASILTLYKASTGGDDWSGYYDLLVPMGPFCSGLFLFFISFMQIAVLNILTGIFVENAMKLAEPDRQAMFSEQQKLHLKTLKELEHIVDQMDVSVDGEISEKEFDQEMERHDSRMREYLGAIGIHTTDAERFFHMLKAAHFGKPVAKDSFVAGILKLPGVAQSIDMQGLTCQLKLVHKKLHDLVKHVKHPETLEL